MNSTKVFVASLNPVKKQSTQNGFQQMFPDKDFSVFDLAAPSGVSAQPMTNFETLQGASNRIDNLMRFTPNADYWVGIEGGVEKVGDQLESFAWVVIRSKEGQIGKSRTASFFLPDEVSRLVLSGMELGDADDLVFGRSNSKQGVGSVGILTGEVLTRTSYYEQAVTLALIPFKNPTLF